MANRGRPMGSHSNPIEISSDEDSDVGHVLEEHSTDVSVWSRIKRRRNTTLSSGSEVSSDEDNSIEDALFQNQFSQTTSPIKRKTAKSILTIEYHCGRKDLPIFVRQKKHLTTTQIIETLLDPGLDRSQICTTQPVAVESNLAFIIDLKYLKNSKDILCDELGAWKCNGCHRTWVVVDEHGIADLCGKSKPHHGDGCYCVIKKYYKHKGSPDFHRLVIFIQDYEGDILNLAMVHYSFDNEEHSILSRPHGNSKSQSAYIRTMPSTLSKLREASQYLPPKHAVGEVCRSVGGVTGVNSVAELPRNRQQSADCRRMLFPSKKHTWGSHTVDPLFPIMIMCKESEGVNTDPNLRFVRIVCNTPEPMSVLTFDWTLSDLERFCTNPRNHTVLSVDPTFNLGSFHVTITTYQHPMLEYRHQKRENHPVMFGPLFIHQRKTFATYNFFFSQLVGLKPSLRGIQCFGTDGEKALEDALQTQFRYAIHLRCFLHFRGNLKSKLSDLGISRSNSQDFIKDVLGDPVLLEEGLVDADSAELDSEFESLKEIWDDRERSITNSSQAYFHNWFRANSLEVVRNCMLKGIREAAGLGSPPEPFYTNDVESKNRVLKHQTSYKPQQLPSFVESMKCLYEDQKLEIEKAVIGLGEYKLCSPYQALETESKEWFKKNSKQRERILQRFAKAELATIDTDRSYLESIQAPVAKCPEDCPSTSNSLTCAGPRVTDCPIDSPSTNNNPLTCTGFPVTNCTEDCLSTSHPRTCTNFPVTDCPEDCSYTSNPLTCTGFPVTDCSEDCPSTSNPLTCTGLPAAIQQSMWAKVQLYLQDGTSYTQSPGVTDYSSVLVKSSSSARPHFVEKISSNMYRCDKDCLMFKSTNGMCSHSLLVATLNGQSDAFVEQYTKTKVPFNYAKLGQHGLPIGGKKPNSKRKGSSKKTTAAIKNIIAGADLIERTKRVKPSAIGSVKTLDCTPTSAIYGVHAPYSNITHFSSSLHVSNLTPPQPLVPYSPGSLPSGQPFYVMFLNARISRCQGCHGEIEHGCHSPNDIVLQHKEQVLFQNPNTGVWQLSRDLRNTYYHPRLVCIAMKYPDFSSSEVRVPHAIKQRFVSSHLSLLTEEFGLQL